MYPCQGYGFLRIWFLSICIHILMDNPCKSLQGYISLPLPTDNGQDNRFLLTSRRSTGRSSTSDSSSGSETPSTHRSDSPEADNAEDGMDEDVEFGGMP